MKPAIEIEGKVAERISNNEQCKTKLYHRNSSGHVIVDEAISSSLLVRKHMGYSQRSYFTAKSGQLGWGMPAAAGISLKVPRVLQIVGDGSIMYTIQTLWTISNYNLPVKILVLDNGGYTILKSFSASFYPGRRGEGR